MHSVDTAASTDAYPLVSVIVPAFNAEMTLAQTLDSVINQTYDKLEILVIDDGSSDQTPAIAEAFSRKDPRITLLRQTNSGVARARNLGLGAARGTYVAPIDADDLWHPAKIERQVQAVRESPTGRSVAYNWYAAIDEDGVIFGSSKPVAYDGDVFRRLLLENFIGNGSTPLIPLADAIACGGYDTTLQDRGAQGCEDYQLYLALAERIPFVVVQDYLTGYRFTKGNMSSNANRMLQSLDLVLDALVDRLPHLSDDIRLVKYETTRWYFRRVQIDRDFRQMSRIAPRLVILALAANVRKFTSDRSMYSPRRMMSAIWRRSTGRRRSLSEPVASHVSPRIGMHFNDPLAENPL